jgi:hypothetical protein
VRAELGHYQDLLALMQDERRQSQRLQIKAHGELEHQGSTDHFRAALSARLQRTYQQLPFDQLPPQVRGRGGLPELAEGNKQCFLQYDVSNDARIAVSAEVRQQFEEFMRVFYLKLWQLSLQYNFTEQLQKILHEDKPLTVLRTVHAQGVYIFALLCDELHDRVDALKLKKNPQLEGDLADQLINVACRQLWESRAYAQTIRSLPRQPVPNAYLLRVEQVPLPSPPPQAGEGELHTLPSARERGSFSSPDRSSQLPLSRLRGRAGEGVAGEPGDPADTRSAAPPNKWPRPSAPPAPASEDVELVPRGETAEGRHSREPSFTPGAT